MAGGRGNCLTDVAGIRVGHAVDERVRTGTTVVLPERAAVAAVDVRGGGPGTRETDALSPTTVVDAVHAVVLSGGSAFGLDAAGGAMQWLAERGRGFQVAGAVVPVVPAAILFDLANGGDKAWGGAPPYGRLGCAAADAAVAEPSAQGNVGAGHGATAGGLKGGLGTASVRARDGATVAALVACNSFGSPVIPGTPCLWAWALEHDGELGGQPSPPPPTRPIEADDDYALEPGASTTIGVVATDAALTPAQAQRVAIMAQDGYARALRPVHTPLDGDTVFVLATGARRLADPIAGLAEIGTLAADCTARALARGVYAAESLGDWQGYRARHGARLAALKTEREA